MTVQICQCSSNIPVAGVPISLPTNQGLHQLTPDKEPNICTLSLEWKACHPCCINDISGYYKTHRSK